MDEVESEQEDLKPESMEETLSQGGRSMCSGGGGRGSFGEERCIVGGETYGGGGKGERFCRDCW